MTWWCRALCGLIYSGNKDELECKSSGIPQPVFFPYKAAHLKIAQVALWGMRESSSDMPKDMAIPSYHQNLEASSHAEEQKDATLQDTCI